MAGTIAAIDNRGHLIGVALRGAVDQNDGTWLAAPFYRPNCDPNLELAAPSANINSTKSYNTNKIRNGTSMAVPVATVGER